MDNNVEVVLLDLGGVIINIDLNLTFKAFAEHSNISEEQAKIALSKSDSFLAFETGRLSETEFIHALNNEFSLNLSKEDFLNIWNELLLDIPLKRIEFIQELRKKYPVYLLSNTNETHIRGVEKTLHSVSGLKGLKDLFDKVFLSYEVNMRKPNADIYEFVLEQIRVEPERIIFADDTLPNIETASRLGYKTYHVTPESDLTKMVIQ